MKTIEEKADLYGRLKVGLRIKANGDWPQDELPMPGRLDLKRVQFDAYDLMQAFEDGATEALQSQWREFPTDKDGLADEEAIDKIALPILVLYQDGYVFTVNYDWGEEAEWYNDILNHPNRYIWLPIPKYEPKKEKR